MKHAVLPLLTLTAALFAFSAQAQSNAPAAPAGDQTQTREQRRVSWENGVKQDCAAEIGSGGVCAGKDFGTGLMDCLHKNRKSLSDGCKAAVHHRHHGMGKKGSQQAPANAPAAPANPPANQ